MEGNPWRPPSGDNPATQLTLSSYWVSRLLSFLNGSMLDVTIKAPLALPQTRSGQVSLTLQNCQPVFTGIHMRAHLLSSVTKFMLKRTLQNSLPNMLCPVVRFWFYIINQQLSILKNVHSLGLFRSLYSALTQVPPSSEPYYRLDFQDKHFPASFINWLIEIAETQRSSYL
ncbi:uncharacterized protein LOC119865597 isoform X1 [Canis lupus familiaris]|uniref:uncharacterized protein LOC119865597 isoform X1 n=1 Tax=Canis lupus familiaris TaxID=9615 RepID=UPI0018F7E19D|nr:uncharacterized protein LOC119865597 isoform X1 [Canis lupus familiaris]